MMKDKRQTVQATAAADGGAPALRDTPSLRDALTAAAFVLVLACFCVLNRVVAPPDVSQSERRELAKMPTLTAGSVADGAFMEGFEGFAQDSFALREALRGVRAFTVFYPFLQTDKGGLYFGASGAGKFEAMDEESLRQAAGKILRVADAMAGDGRRFFYSFVPDKSVYAGRAYPGFDVARAEALLGQSLDGSGVAYLGIAGLLDGADFYRTDLHWTQPAIAPVAEALARGMGSELPPIDSSNPLFAGAFEGVYPGQLALPVGADRMEYIGLEALSGYSALGGAGAAGGASSDSPASISARYLDDKTLEWADGDVYDTAAFTGRDPYDLFLRGAQALIELRNPNATAPGRTLYLFRDSFSSSLAPLLAPAYGKIVLVDLRYVQFAYLGELLGGFDAGADVLFLYSSQILNHANTLLV